MSKRSRCGAVRFYYSRNGHWKLSRGLLTCFRNRAVAGSIPPWSAAAPAGKSQLLSTKVFCDQRKLVQSNLLRELAWKTCSEESAPTTCSEQLAQRTCLENLLKGTRANNLLSATITDNLLGELAQRNTRQQLAQMRNCAENLLGLLGELTAAANAFGPPIF